MIALFRCFVPTIALVLGCSRASPPPRSSPTLAAGDSAHSNRAGATTTSVERVIVTKDSARSIGDLFADAERSFNAADWTAAAQSFDRVSQLDENGPYAAAALYDAALSYDELGDREVAAQRFSEVARRFVESPLARESLLRAIRLEEFMEHWQVAGQYALTLLERYPGPRPLEGIVAYGARATAALDAGQLDTAAYFVEKGRQIIDDERLDSAGRIPRDLAQLYYALGELRRLRGEAVHLDPSPEHFAQVLEQRCQLLLDAQGAYSDVMRAYDAHWSEMAGFRVGELYERLHQELMAVPPPKFAGDERRRLLFEGAMRLRYSVLLEKGLAMMEHTLAMAERVRLETATPASGTHVDAAQPSVWVARAREAQARMQQAMAKEQEVIQRLPYTRAELERALDELATEHRPSGRSGAHSTKLHPSNGQSAGSP